jgi:hypothetical protein
VSPEAPAEEAPAEVEHMKEQGVRNPCESMEPKTLTPQPACSGENCDIMFAPIENNAFCTGKHCIGRSTIGALQQNDGSYTDPYTRIHFSSQKVDEADAEATRIQIRDKARRRLKSRSKMFKKLRERRGQLWPKSVN